MKLEINTEAVREIRRRPWYLPSLTTQIFLALILGAVVGYLGYRHDHVFDANHANTVPADMQWHIGDQVYFLRDIFLNLIKSIIAPLVFSTLVVGIAGSGDIKKVGRMGWKALVYFEIITTLALVIGLTVVNVVKPGVVGPDQKPLLVAGADTSSIATIAATHPQGWRDILVHAFPASVVDSMVRGDVLQIVAFAVVFAIALTTLGDAGRPVLAFLESLSQIMFRFTSYVMLFAPVGIAAAMIHTVDAHGLAVLFTLGKLVGSLYLALAILLVFVFGGVMLLCRIPVLPFLRMVREPATVAFATTSSESALPKALENVERFGVPARVAGFVMPTGYSFNLDGSTLYLAIASVFVAQAAERTTGYHMSIGHQIGMMLALMLTSKGVAAVPRASLVILLATLDSFLEPRGSGLGAIGVALIFAVDEVMDMARTCVNLIGNCLACCVVARWEGEFDAERAAAFGTPREITLAEREEATAELSPAMATGL